MRVRMMMMIMWSGGGGRILGRKVVRGNGIIGVMIVAVVIGVGVVVVLVSGR